MIKIFISAIIFSFMFSNYVYWEPAIPSPGGTIEIFYDSEQGTLENNISSLFIHLGYNGWQDVDDYEMFYQPQIPDGNWFKFIYNIPENAETVDFVFTDGNGTWDNNGGVGIDWHISLSSFWSPLQPTPNDIIEIVISDPMIDEVAWMVEVGENNFAKPNTVYWPEGSYEQGNFVISPLQESDNGTRLISIGPFDEGYQIVQSIKFIGRQNNGNWDQLSNGQLPFYDIYINFESQDNDPYVFFLSPSEGSLISGATQIMTVGDAQRVEYWLNGNIIGQTENGPPFSITWNPESELFGDNEIYAIAIPEQKNSLSALDIKNKLDDLGFNTNTSNSLENALNKADDKIPLLITGSLYLAGYALKFNESIID